MTSGLSRKWNAPSISTYDGGVAIFGLRGHGRGNEDPPKRGKISGWSTSSRKRMREYLLTHGPKDGCRAFGLTLTVPGPQLEPEKARWLWDHFSKNFITREGMGAVWRIEVQERGAAHWHCLLVAPKWWRPELLKKKITDEWLKALDLLPPWWVWRCSCFNSESLPGTVRHCAGGNFFDVSREPPPAALTHDALPESLKHLQEAFDYLNTHAVLVGSKCITVHSLVEAKAVGCLSRWPGASLYSVDVQTQGWKGAWLRYLQDHATKAKQAQIAQGFGRHWGVVGRKAFREIAPSSEMVFTCKASYFRFWRAYHRLTRPVMMYRLRREKCVEKFKFRPFRGKSLGWSSTRGVYGNSVWFSKPDTVRRLFEWAENSCAENRGAGGVGAPGQ